MPKISLLTATYGRRARIEELLAMFLTHDYANRELVILNNHPVALNFDHPLVRILNEPGHPSLGHCRQRLLDFADGEFCQTYDDDDLHLPWKLSQAVERIGDDQAWKPKESWWMDGDGMGSGKRRRPGVFELAANAMESSILFRTDFVKSVGYQLTQQGEHGPLLAAIGNKLAISDMGQWTGYCYMWRRHDSGMNASIAQQDAASWRMANSDASEGPLVPAYGRVLAWYRKLVKFVDPGLQTAWMKAIFSSGPANASKVTTHMPRKATGRLVAASGCWDGLHGGHVETLRWARLQGDYLTVLINDDYGVRIQKGADRPLVPLEGRIASLMALDFVDQVVVVQGKNDLPQLIELRPAILVKGPEYANRVAEVPAPQGCQVLCAPVSSYKEHTSDIVRQGCPRNADSSALHGGAIAGSPS